MAQYATLDALNRIVPEVKCVTEPGALNRALADAEVFVGLEAYGDKAEQAHAYYATHLLACRFPLKLGGELGQLTALKAGEISSSLAAPTPTEGLTNTTKWGRLFLQVCGQTVAPYQVG